MAKKKSTTGKMTKTAAIREELRQSKDGSPSQIAKKLNARGIKVSPEYVSTIKASDKRKELQGGPRRGPGRPSGSTQKRPGKMSDLQHTSELLEKAFDLVVLVGEQKAKQLVTTAARMVDRLKP